MNQLLLRTIFASALVAAAPALATTPTAEAAADCAGIDPVLAGSSFVLVRTPAAGERIASGAVVTGCSRTHEGSVAFRLLGRDGRTLTSGSTRGGGFAGAAPFRFVLEFAVPLPERGTLELSEPRVTDEGFEPPRISLPVVVAAAASAGTGGVPGDPPAAAATATSTAAAAELPLFARYLGTLPCADCGGIRTELSLYGDLAAEPRRFELVETYLATKDGDRRVESRGAWGFAIGTADLPNAIVIGLEVGGGERRAFVVDGKDLVLLDRAGKKIDSKHNHRLARQP